MNKKLFLAVLLSVGVLFSAGAQSQRDAKQQRGCKEGQKPDPAQFDTMNAQRIADAIALDDATTAKFVPLYVEYNEAVRAEFKGSAPKKEQGRMSDAEVDARIRENFNKSRKILDLREAYYEKFLTILTPRQIQKMYEEEKHFGRQASEAHARRGGMEGGRPQGPRSGFGPHPEGEAGPNGEMEPLNL